VTRVTHAEALSSSVLAMGVSVWAIGVSVFAMGARLGRAGFGGGGSSMRSSS